MNRNVSFDSFRCNCMFVFFSGNIADVFTGLQQNGLLNTYSHLLTGYIGKDSFLREIATIVKAIREVNPSFTYGLYI